MKKIGLTFAHDYIKFYPNCRKAGIGDMLHQLSPWHRSPKKASETTLKTAPKGGLGDPGFRTAE
jgi:hypothetical protein